jgi:hypothetical protein
MTNYLAKFSNKREISFPATTLQNAKQFAIDYATKNCIFVKRVTVR